MIINTTRNKLKQIEKLNNSNEILIKRLDNLNLKENTISFNKKESEIILLENFSLFDAPHYQGTCFQYSYQFNNLQDKDLCFLKPYSILSNISTSPSYVLNGAWGDGVSFYFWEKYQSSHILKFIIQYTQDYSNFLDIKITLKIKIYQPQLFKNLKVIK